MVYELNFNFDATKGEFFNVLEEVSEIEGIVGMWYEPTKNGIATFTVHATSDVINKGKLRNVVNDIIDDEYATFWQPIE